MMQDTLENGKAVYPRYFLLSPNILSLKPSTTKMYIQPKIRNVPFFQMHNTYSVVTYKEIYIILLF